MIIKVGAPLLVVVMLVSRPLFAEQMSIDRQIRLSPEHRVMPYHITRASDGDLIIFGSNNQVDFKAWATRVRPSGEVRWEYLQSGGNGWDDQSEKGQRYDTAIELPDHTTLLCGVKVVNFQRSVLLDRLGVDGTLIDERVIRPDWNKGSLTGFECVRWNDGIALIGGVSGFPSGTGWLAKLDWKLDLQWQKFDDLYVGSDVMETTGGGFFYLNTFQKTSTGSRNSLIKMGPTGEVMARHSFSDDDNPAPVYAVVPRSNVRMALFNDTLHTEIIDLDDQLRGPTRVIKLHNAGVKKCLELPDGSIAIFGSQYHNGATAAVTRVYRDGSSRGFLVEPPYQSGWYYDAVLVGSDKQFAAVRLVDDGRAVLDWVSFK